MIEKSSVETAYCFLHQKQRVYQYSTMGWQKEDIEFAIGDYVEQMDPELYQTLSAGNPEYLRNHLTFAAELSDALGKLEGMLTD